MNEMVMSAEAAELATQFLYYLLLTAHVCLFVDMSPMQKHPACKLNYAVASVVSALLPCIAIRLMTFPTLILKHAAGVGIAVLLSIVITLFIQQVVKVNIDF
jgi:hypothetical protein